MRRLAVLLLICGIGGGIAAPVSSSRAADLPGWQTEPVASMVPVFRAGCPRLDQRFARACAMAAQVPPGDEAAARAFLDAAFRPVYQGGGTVSGYFEITVAGSRTPNTAFPIPVLRAPGDPRRFSRAEIELGALAGQRLELLFLHSRADLFFLQLQGSGRVRLPEGEIRVGTAATNGRRQIDTADLFGDAGIPGRDLSIPGIRAFLARNPGQEDRLLRDPSYVFFRETPGLSPYYGPLGEFGLPLVPRHSVAVDTGVIPLGALLWLDARSSATGAALPHLVIAHDTGPQIHGPARLDLFFGAGEAAEQEGGRQYGAGQVWQLVPR